MSSVFLGVLPSALLAMGLVACKGPGPKQVGEARLAMASGVEKLPAEAENAPVVEILPDRPATVPDAPVVKLAIDRDATWGQVKATLHVIDQRKQKAILLVAERRTVRSLPRFDQVDKIDVPDLLAHAIEITAYTDGKVCVRHPTVAEAKCVQTPSRTYIDGAFTRQLVREAVDGYKLTKTVADLPDALQWDDAVRVIDGVRTCCGAKREPQVSVVALPPDAFPERMQIPAE
ncbi:MAG TPA: hypothetical protein VNM90_02120 [Haliangium sp.]|nr:hypothetical protein [Haliangium sp.]